MEEDKARAALKAAGKPVPKQKPVEYRLSRDGSLKPVVSKGCRGCHKKRG
jgi:hypothetical protein